MPQVSGIDLAIQLRDIGPEAPKDSSDNGTEQPPVSLSADLKLALVEDCATQNPSGNAAEGFPFW
jgi:hypothetical protein